MEFNQVEKLKSVNWGIETYKELINQDAVAGKLPGNKVFSDQLPYILKVFLLQRAVGQGFDTEE
jgi:hypothetical protein